MIIRRSTSQDEEHLFNNFPRKHNKHSLLHKRLMFLSIWVKNKQQSVYVDLQKTDFEPRLLKIGEKWVFLENTRLPQKASETTADDAETSQVSN